LADALDEHRRHLELPVARRRARRLAALADFSAEHGDNGLRLLGGRRGAEGFLAELDPTLDAAAMRRALEERAGVGGLTRRVRPRCL
jgi:hypothetical protein